MRSLSAVLALSLFASVATVAVVVPGCSSASATAPDATPALSDITSAVIVPTYKQIDTDAASLVSASKALQSGASTTTLAAAQAAWRAARKSWNNAEAFRFGPVVSLNVQNAIDFWPARPTTIDAYVTGTGPVDATSYAALGSNAQGYHAIEYILFDSSNGDAAVLAKLTTDAAAARRLSYLVLAATDLQAKTTQLRQAWDPDFAREVSNAGTGSVLFPSGKAAVDQIVNTTIFALDDVAGTKIGKPYGNKNAGKFLADQEESPLSDNSINDMLDALASAKNTYTGAAGGTGISSLVRSKNADLDAQVLAAFDTAASKVNAIPAPFRTAITDDAKRPAIGDAYQACRALKNLMQVQVANTLGTTLQFNDNDGD